MIDVNSVLHVFLAVGIFATLAMVIYMVRRNTMTERRLAEERFAAVEELRRRAESLAKEVAVTLDARLTSIDKAQTVIKHELGADDGDPSTTTRDKIESIDQKTEALRDGQKKAGDA